ncbi:peptidylprolyl isomerase [Hyphobacterium sp. HN65]|uniref:peptidylprolyl isomerase n=1 Tax=Hyphobacterium lacteum TaxID=3116575 RepID=A0ABU7LTC5_9PROT|nr:peptidylprolyl isomerase [Hyphobacterium sp. HN65]MEE2527162.1 peptidylprolyl isomerase [Hyphobacterium sp. HN65]
MKRFWMSGVFGLALAAAACADNSADEAAVTGDATETSETSGSVGEVEMANLVQEPAAEPVEEVEPFEFPEDAWREVPQDRLLYIETDHGMIIVEMAPEFAPLHVERMTTLANERFYDLLVWHRVIDDFVAQGGGSRSNPSHSTTMDRVPGEFTVRRSPAEIVIYETQDRVINPRSNPSIARAGFWNGFPAGTQAAALAGITADGRVESWLLHCEGAAAMARTSDPNSAGSQFYITRGNAEHLNAQYTVWGRVRSGQDAVNAIAVGTAGQDAGFTPDTIRSMRVGSDESFDGQVNVEVVDTNSDAFAMWLGPYTDEGLDICDIDVPVRITE